jgi:hypothetical protein
MKSAPGQEKWYTLVCINPCPHINKNTLKADLEVLNVAHLSLRNACNTKGIRRTLE